MISTNLQIEDIYLNRRDPLGYYFAKWFDEPFTVDVLNRIKYKDCTFVLADAEDDRNHIDFRFTSTDNTIHTVDSKIHIHNFAYKDSKDIMRYADVVTLGQYALKSMTEYISFVRRGYIVFVKHNEMYNLRPIKETFSIGKNGNQQYLYHYDVKDLIELPSTEQVEIPADVTNCYDNAYCLFTDCRTLIYNKFKNKSMSISDKAEMFNILKKFSEDLIPIINDCNNIYISDVPDMNLDTTFSEITDFISSI